MRAAAQGGRGEGGRRATAGTEVHEASPGSEQTERGGRRVAADGVDHEVDGAAGGVAEPALQFVDVGVRQVRDRRGTPCERALARERAPTGRDHRPGAERDGDLDGDLADDTAGAEDEHPFTGPQAAAAGERHDGRDGGEPEGRRVDVGDPGRQRDQLPASTDAPRSRAHRPRGACRRRWRTRPACPPAGRRRPRPTRHPGRRGRRAAAAARSTTSRVAQSRSSGTIGAADTRTTTSPGPGCGSRNGSGRGGSPYSVSTAAVTSGPGRPVAVTSRCRGRAAGGRRAGARTPAGTRAAPRGPARTSR